MKSLNMYIRDIIGISGEMLLILGGIALYYFHFLNNHNSVFTSIVITSFVVAVYDVFLKSILLFPKIDDYYKLVINNAITIVIIDFLITSIRNKGIQNGFVHYFNLGFSCMFYDMIVYKIYNHNQLCNSRLRTTMKTIMRLGTIHILSNFLNGSEYGEQWFSFSFGQLVNFALFDAVFND